LSSIIHTPGFVCDRTAGICGKRKKKIINKKITILSHQYSYEKDGHQQLSKVTRD
jgi:hypothetical protein